MPDKRRHRGPHPQDEVLFSEAQIPRLRRALADLSWLLSGGYAEQSSLKLVGDRFRLNKRQRMAVSRRACSRQASLARRRKKVPPEEMRGQSVEIDGFNLLITVESALSGGLVIEGQDGCYRDLAGLHGSYKRVEETEEAVRWIGKALEDLGVRSAGWLLDRPVSNSGKLRRLLEEMAESAGWNWAVALSFNPDKTLMESEKIVLSSDSQIIDHAGSWFNGARHLVDRYLPQAPVVRLC